MRNRIVITIFAIILIALGATPALAQTTTVKGKISDDAGKPIPGAVVEFYSPDTGRKITLKTDNAGNYLSIGVPPSIYKITISKDGKVLWSIEKYQVSLDKEENVININLAKERKAAAATAQQQMTPEQKKEYEAAQAQHSKIQNLNGMLKEAAAAEQAGNYDSAIATLTQATQIGPMYNLIWGRLGQVNLAAAKKDTDATSRTAKYQAAVVAYKKAIDLATASPDPKDKLDLAGFYNNYGEALAKTGHIDEAVAAYNSAAQIDPTKAAPFYYNLGVILTNANKSDDSVTAFDKAIAADPTMAEAYYYKGIALLGKATVKGDKMIAPEGTAEAFNKYLELKPDGPLADPAKQMLASIGAKVQTSYGKSRKKK